jgi:hypothetical protein
MVSLAVVCAAACLILTYGRVCIVSLITYPVLITVIKCLSIIFVLVGSVLLYETCFGFKFLVCLLTSGARAINYKRLNVNWSIK